MVSLKLLKQGKVIFSSEKNWLTPLYEAINRFKNESDLFLFDKVIGLAAAKLIVYSKMISEIETPLISRYAKEYLDKHKIKITYAKIVDNIVKPDGTMCEMEKLAKTVSAKKTYEEVGKRIQTNIKNKKQR